MEKKIKNLILRLALGSAALFLIVVLIGYGWLAMGPTGMAELRERATASAAGSTESEHAPPATEEIGLLRESADELTAATVAKHPALIARIEHLQVTSRELDRDAPLPRPFIYRSEFPAEIAPMGSDQAVQGILSLIESVRVRAERDRQKASGASAREMQHQFMRELENVLLGPGDEPLELRFEFLASNRWSDLVAQAMVLLSHQLGAERAAKLYVSHAKIDTELGNILMLLEQSPMISDQEFLQAVDVYSRLTGSATVIDAQQTARAIGFVDEMMRQINQVGDSQLLVKKTNTYGFLAGGAVVKAVEKMMKPILQQDLERLAVAGVEGNTKEAQDLKERIKRTFWIMNVWTGRLDQRIDRYMTTEEEHRQTLGKLFMDQMTLAAVRFKRLQGRWPDESDTLPENGARIRLDSFESMTTTVCVDWDKAEWTREAITRYCNDNQEMPKAAADLSPYLVDEDQIQAAEKLFIKLDLPAAKGLWFIGSRSFFGPDPMDVIDSNGRQPRQIEMKAFGLIVPMSDDDQDVWRAALEGL